MKEALARVIAARVKSGETIGLGSGTTTELAIKAIGRRVAEEKLSVYGVPSSLRTAQVAAEAGIVVLDLRVTAKIDWAFDGADEVDPELNLLKGRGAAMLYEKILASRADSLCILVTEDKLVSALGEGFALPVEVISEAVLDVEKALLTLGATECQLRAAEKKYGEVVTEKGNLVLDVRFAELSAELETKIKSIPGVVETGFFGGFDPEVLVASNKESLYSLRPSANGGVERVAVK